MRWIVCRFVYEYHVLDSHYMPVYIICLLILSACLYFG